MGKVISAAMRRNIEAQGFLGLDDSQIAQLNTWLRFSPAVCLIWTAAGVYYGSPGLLASLLPFALLGGVLRSHPFDAVYNYGIRFLTGGPRIPAYGPPRRFACLTASSMLACAAAGFAAGFPAVGYAIGGTMIAAASVNVLTGFCIPSFVFEKLVDSPDGGRRAGSSV